MPGPSGEQYEIVYGDQRAVVTQVGGGLRVYSEGDRQIIDGYGADEMCPSGRGQVLIPWPNRIAGGRYEFAGRHHQLPIDEHASQSAIHGLVRWAAWSAPEREANRVAVLYDLHPQPGYPFALALRIEYMLSDDGLEVSTTATNVGSEPCPYGVGAHPYLFAGQATVDTASLRLPAASVLEPEAAPRPVAGPFDFRSARPVGETKLDHCFTDLERDGDGLVRVVLTSAEGDARVSLWADEGYPFLMLYTGDDRPDVARRSLAVEPMSCPPNAFQTGQSMLTLEPGDTVVTRWGLSPR